jgi:hypothetical protein
LDSLSDVNILGPSNFKYALQAGRPVVLYLHETRPFIPMDEGVSVKKNIWNKKIME